jgi:tetratricopeptide (TPR) repeat protein
MNFGNQQKLIYRLKSAAAKGNKISFLFGSGLTVSNHSMSMPGVFSVAEIVNKITDIFRADNCIDLLEDEMNGSVNNKANQYQIAMRTLLECHGQDQLNNIIRDAVLEARINKNSIVIQSDLTYQELEKDYENWFLNKGLTALASLYKLNRSKFNDIILTSNFDPLIEISLNKQGVTTQTLNIPKDGRTNTIINNDNVTSVAHFHGYWRGSDTLHTITQLTRARPNLKGSLKQLLKNTTLIVIGYGGWNDVFTKTLVEMINENDEDLNVLWTFYSEKDDEIINNNKDLFEQLEPSLEQRVVLYKGIDCNVFLPQLLETFQMSNLMTNNLGDLKKPNSELTLIKQIDTRINQVFTSDNPVVNYKWVGRNTALRAINHDIYKVVYICGIGGQGKSGLAARYLEDFVNNNSIWEFWDWRDCKEEANRIHTKIISIIERLTNGVYRASTLLGEKFEDIINLFFDLIKDRKIVFVFDNLDYYVDIEKFKFIGPVENLFSKALSNDHTCKFIFTGRPYIENVSASSLVLKLEGLNLEETNELFITYSLPLSKSYLVELSKNSYSLTNGHPLWLLLIIGQAFKGKENVEDFLNEMKSSDSFKGGDESDILAANVLDAIWKRLTNNQQLLLRIFSEIVRSETMENLYKISSSEFRTYNKFNSSVNTLINLNLIVTKSYPNEKDEFDLHPLVKQFIRRKYIYTERSKFITLIVNYYNNILLVFKPKLDYKSPLSIFEKFTAKIELEVNRRSYEEALMTLHEITNSIKSAGYTAEYIRISHLLFINIDWEMAIVEEYAYFHDSFHNYIYSLSEFGKYDDALNYLNKYLKNIAGKGINYIDYCKSTSYVYWFQEKFDKAIVFAEEGEALRKVSNIDTNILISHNLALALRDTKNEININKALEIFRLGEPIDEIINPTNIKEELGGTFYGNIGRCFFYKNQIDQALICYKKSVSLLKANIEFDTLLNLGYAFHWIAELYEQKKQYEETLYFYTLSKFYWHKTSPVKYKKVEEKISLIISIPENVKLIFIDTLSEWEVEKYCETLLNLKVLLN